MSMEDIDALLLNDQKDRLVELNLNAIDSGVANEKELPPEYKDFRDVFNRSRVDKLPPYRSYNYKIELTSDIRPPQSRAYRISLYKIQRIKEYLTKNLSKGFITPSQALYSSPVLFTLKSNSDLRFYIDYRKLNTLTKRNRYPLPLIKEVISKIIGYKYLTRLDIITVFNKLRIDLGSKDLTTFVTVLGAYKYKVLPFGLTNSLSSF